MTTVYASSAATQSLVPPKVEPKAGAHKQRLLDQISAQQQAGSLSATDASALTSAVQDIDQALSGRSGTNGTRLDPAQAGSRMDDLISGEVAKGTLTSDQATTLKNLLSSQKGGGQDGDRGDRVGGAGGPPPGPPPSGDAGAAGSTDAASSASDLLASFLKQLQGAQAQNQASGYGASGSAQKGSQAAVFDFRV